MKPIRPEEVIDKKRESLPHQVIEVFNEFIAERWNGYCSSFKQKDIEKVIVKRLNIGRVTQKQYTAEDLYKKNWMDVEDIYRKAGWIVRYDKPGYNESYDATFEFRRPSKRDTPTPGGYI
jgi:hypothetical protein